jgi:hypothetical protein
MRVHLERAGGFAPSAMRLSRAVDSDELSTEEAAALKALVADADVAALAGRVRNSPPRPDAFHYRVTVDSDDGRHTVEASDGDMPATLRLLVEWVIKQSR